MTIKPYIVCCFFAAISISGCGNAAAKACMAEADTAYQKLKSAENIAYVEEHLLTSADMAASQKTEVLADYADQTWYQAVYSDSVIYKEELFYDGTSYYRMAQTDKDWVPEEEASEPEAEINVLDGLFFDSESISKAEQEKSGVITMKLSDAGLDQLRRHNADGAKEASEQAAAAGLSTEQVDRQNQLRQEMEEIRYLEGEVRVEMNGDGVLTSYSISLKLAMPAEEGEMGSEKEVQSIYKFTVKDYDQPEIKSKIAEYLHQG